MSKTYFTITGLNHYYGGEFFEKGMTVKLKKEPDNEYDSEAIMVKLKGIGKVGYVANSPYTVLGESYSAGRLYDKIGKKAHGKVEYVLPKGIICSLVEENKGKTEPDADSDIDKESALTEQIVED